LRFGFDVQNASETAPAVQPDGADASQDSTAQDVGWDTKTAVSLPDLLEAQVDVEDAGAGSSVDTPKVSEATEDVTSLADASPAQELSDTSDATPLDAPSPDAPTLDAAASPDLPSQDTLSDLSEIGPDVQDVVDVVADAPPVPAPDVGADLVTQAADAPAPVDVVQDTPADSPVTDVPASPPGALPGWSLTWADEFDGLDGSGVNPSIWKRDVGCGPDEDGWGNAELEYYTDGASNAFVQGGALRITAKTMTTGSAYTCPGYGTVDYTSARLHTQSTFSQEFGRIEARMQVATGIGLWSAFWMMGSDYTPDNWPDCGEIDVMENIGDEPAIVHGAIHGPTTDTTPIGDQYLDEGINGKTSIPGVKLTDGFHVYAIEWQTDQVRWYLDGQLYFQATPASLPPGATWVWNHPFFLILNLAVGGNFPDPPAPDATTPFPSAFVIDYVRVYKKL
jgi:beta-glucanase (GH16 family)